MAFILARFLCFSLTTIVKISQTAGVLLKPHIPVLVVALLESLSGLEPQVLNYLSLHAASNQETLDKVWAVDVVHMYMRC